MTASISLHIFEHGTDPLVCDRCSLRPDHSLHFHKFRDGYSKALCACGYPSDADCHILVVNDDEESLDLSRRDAAELANREHDSEVILQFRAWISAHNRNSISIVELGRVLELYAAALRKGPLK